MNGSTLRFATFLAPAVFPVYKFISEYVGQKLGVKTELVIGESFAQFEQGQVDVGFICGLPYVELTRRSPKPVELLAAPVLMGERYAGRPIYYSDVIVHAESPFRTFADLRGCRWSYNDPDSQSGYGITRYTLVRMGETGGFFGEAIEAGFHQESIRLVCEGEVDASAIDSQVLALAMRAQPELASRLRVIDSLGPSTIQPVVASRHLPEEIKAQISEALTGMAAYPEAREQLAAGLFERFVAIPDAAYDDIREMLRMTEAARFTTLR